VDHRVGSAGDFYRAVHTRLHAVEPRGQAKKPIQVGFFFACALNLAAAFASRRVRVLK
jgi:hypothetical protein